MELSVLMTIFLVCIVYPQRVTTKSSALIVNDSKLRLSQKQNFHSTTAKPESQYQLLQYRGAPTERPDSYLTQNSASTPQQLQQITMQSLQNQQPWMQQTLSPVPMQQIPTPIQTQLHPQSQQQILQLIQKVLYNAQQSNQPTAMIIIAQPIYPGYPNNAQQLLNYFQGNPQARYQLVHGTEPTQQYYPQPAVQTIQPEASYPAQSQQYQTKILPFQTTSQITHMSPIQSSQTYNQLPVHPQDSQIAQLAAEQYYPQSQYHQLEGRDNNGEYPTLPPIITGFENFSPEQQEKIKAQLSAHFGSPLRPLGGQKEAESGSKYRLNTNEFVPSPQVKSGRSESNIMNVSKKNYGKM